jgi:hypothetical protein
MAASRAQEDLHILRDPTLYNLIEEVRISAFELPSFVPFRFSQQRCMKETMEGSMGTSCQRPDSSVQRKSG